MAGDGGRMSASVWNAREDRIVERALEIIEFLQEGMLADGYPPFHEPRSERDEYDELAALKAAGHPSFWQSPEAQARFLELMARYGPPPAPAPSPLGVTM